MIYDYHIPCNVILALSIPNTLMDSGEHDPGAVLASFQVNRSSQLIDNIQVQSC